MKAEKIPRTVKRHGDEDRVADPRQDDVPEDAERSGADVARRFDRRIGDAAEPGEQDQDGERDIVPEEADHRAPGRQIGRADLRQADRVQEEIDRAVRAEHADESVGEDDRGHEEREDREALHIGRQPAGREAQVERERQADDEEKRPSSRRSSRASP